MTQPLGDDEREQIADALNAGESIHSVAQRFERSKATVFAIARERGIERSAAQKKTTQALLDYNAQERVNLLNKAFAKANEILDGVERPGQLMQWAIAMGTLTDKRRLEDGESTSRSEVGNIDDARARLAGRLDELAARRGARQPPESALG